jgi:hypothetical protein
VSRTVIIPRDYNILKAIIVEFSLLPYLHEFYPTLCVKIHVTVISGTVSEGHFVMPLHPVGIITCFLVVVVMCSVYVSVGLVMSVW